MEKLEVRKNQGKISPFGKLSRRDFSSFKNFINSSITDWFFFLWLVLILSMILAYQIDFLPSNLQVGRIITQDIKSDRNYEILDIEATESNRSEAEQTSLPVYDYDPSVSTEIEQKLKQAYRRARGAMELSEAWLEAGNVFQNELGITLNEAILKPLGENLFSEEAEMRHVEILQENLKNWVVASRGVLPREEGSGLIIRKFGNTNLSDEVTLRDFSEIKSVEEIQNLLEQKANNPSNQFPFLSSLYLITKSLVLPNLTYNSVATDNLRSRVVSNIPDVIIKVQAGETIIRGGDRIEPYHLTILNGIRHQKTQTRFGIKIIGTGLFVFLLLMIIFAFSKSFIRKFNPTRQDLYFLGFTLILVLVVVRFSAALAGGIKDLVPFDLTAQAYYYAIPVAAGAMLVRYILNSEIALVFAIVLSALTGMFFQADLDLSIYFLLSCIVAAAAIARVERRASILRAGVIVGAVNALMILAIKLVTVVSVTNVFNLSNILLNVSLGFIGGLLASIFVMVLAPIAEMIFDYVTDIKLLELGNMNHPLLRDMIVKAPGTYHHSQLVAVLSEAAATEIGANPLLARVGSYFHDIGKMRKPSYFIENQPSGVNRHDKLSPSMSALIIASHVKDGLELAKEYKLPRKVSAFIPEHQGTKVISFFYKKACENASPNDTPVDKKDYSYPGPRPQSRESGITLLADGVEAAVRSLPEKSPQKIRAKVKLIINANFSEEQLDECDLTLRDIHVIAETFIRVLIGIYHQRIEYPEAEEGNAKVTPIKPGIEKRASPKN